MANKIKNLTVDRQYFPGTDWMWYLGRRPDADISPTSVAVVKTTLPNGKIVWTEETVKLGDGRQHSDDSEFYADNQAQRRIGQYNNKVVMGAIKTPDTTYPDMMYIPSGNVPSAKLDWYPYGYEGYIHPDSTAVPITDSVARKAFQKVFNGEIKDPKETIENMAKTLGKRLNYLNYFK